MWVVCLMREGWAVRQRGKCCERIVLMIVACGGRIEKQKMYNQREMDSLSCSQQRQHCGKCVAETKVIPWQGAVGLGLQDGGVALGIAQQEHFSVSQPRENRLPETAKYQSLELNELAFVLCWGLLFFFS